MKNSSLFIQCAHQEVQQISSGKMSMEEGMHMLVSNLQNARRQQETEVKMKKEQLERLKARLEALQKEHEKRVMDWALARHDHDMEQYHALFNQTEHMRAFLAQHQDVAGSPGLGGPLRPKTASSELRAARGCIEGKTARFKGEIQRIESEVGGYETQKEHLREVRVQLLEGHATGQFAEMQNYGWRFGV